MRPVPRWAGLALLLLTAPCVAATTIYTYTDDTGTPTVTNEWDAIPTQYRARAVPFSCEGPSPPTLNSPGSMVRVISASGEYRMGDHDTKSEAVRLAIEAAKRQALEQGATYLEAVTEITNTVITSDALRSHSSGIVTVLHQQISTRLEGETIVIHAELTAQVDSSKSLQSFAPGLAGMAIYTYTDAAGTLTFTNEWESIPTQYRTQAVRFDSAGSSSTAPSSPRSPVR